MIGTRLIVAGLGMMTACVPATQKTWRISINGGQMRMLYYSAHDLDGVNTSVTRAVLAVHGASHDGESTYRVFLTAAQTVGVDATTAIIAPKFFDNEEQIAHPLHRFMPADYPVFAAYGSGGDAIFQSGSENHPVSSFEIGDVILARLANASHFPNVTTIVVAGHSGGGQFTWRYALTNQMEQQLTGKTVKYAVANPGSYAYVGNKRFNTGDITTFAVPSTSCQHYNDWMYGLEGLNRYANKAGASAIVTQFGSRRLRLLLGTADNDPDHFQLDTGCAAALMGAHRFERGKAVWNHLRETYSGAPANMDVGVVSGVAHDSLGMFNSACGREFVFGGSGGCTPQTAAFSN